MRPASEAERRRLNDLFAELCAIPSPFGHEAACAARVREELESLRLHGEEGDAGALRSDFGYVFDHASAIGEVVVASPTYFRIEAAFHGKAAHAGIRPEDGRSAIVAAARAVTSLRLGRLDEETTANVGSIEGGTGGTNVVPEHARFLAEARSIDDAKVDAVVAEMIDRT